MHVIILIARLEAPRIEARSTNHRKERERGVSMRPTPPTTARRHGRSRGAQASTGKHEQRQRGELSNDDNGDHGDTGMVV